MASVTDMTHRLHWNFETSFIHRDILIFTLSLSIVSLIFTLDYMTAKLAVIVRHQNSLCLSVSHSSTFVAYQCNDLLKLTFGLLTVKVLSTHLNIVNSSCDSSYSHNSKSRGYRSLPQKGKMFINRAY